MSSFLFITYAIGGDFAGILFSENIGHLKECEIEEHLALPSFEVNSPELEGLVEISDILSIIGVGDEMGHVNGREVDEVEASGSGRGAGEVGLGGGEGVGGGHDEEVDVEVVVGGEAFC
ncbi:hypothetical protein Vadar_032328 [Vaccinium darrowii]|uniref:Uncharacterized protein n=1 Tax=Vaccinium darrowii TaxID=229202 RepID=A0ACB7YA58_9ERIC|nr:hypothetical protein Vadar_032328 [Vaccinium darrowii]